MLSAVVDAQDDIVVSFLLLERRKRINENSAVSIANAMAAPTSAVSTITN
jgi:hypothetical protein